MRSQILIYTAAVLALTVGCTRNEPVAPKAAGPQSPLIEAMPASLPGSAPEVPVGVLEPPQGIVLTSDADVRAAWRKAVGLVEERRFEEALPLLEAVAGSRENDAGVLYVLGVAQWKTGRLDEADASLARSVDVDPTRFKGWLNLARVRLDAGRDEGAFEAAQRAIELDGSSADALHQSGRALCALGRTEEAVATLGSALLLDPANGHVANTLGWILIREGRFDEAVPALEAARDALPGVSYVRNNLGVAYERTGRRAEALDEYRAAVEAGDSSGKAAASLARLGGSPDAGDLVASQP